MENLQATREKKVRVYQLLNFDQWICFGTAELVLSLQEEKQFIQLIFQAVEGDLNMIRFDQAEENKQEQLTYKIKDVVYCQIIQEKILTIMLRNSEVLALSFWNFDYCSSVETLLAIKIPSFIFIQNRVWKINSLLVFGSEEERTLTNEKMNEIIEQLQFLRIKPNKILSGLVFDKIKQYFTKGKPISIRLLVQDYFPYLLEALSYNYQFGDRRIDYPSVFNQTKKHQNLLQIKDPKIQKAYEEIMRARFLMSTAAAMLIQPYTESILNEMIIQNAKEIISHMATQPLVLAFKTIFMTDPINFIKIFSELGDLFRSITISLQSIQTKKAFFNALHSAEIINSVYQSVINLGVLPDEDQIVYQLFMEQLNPFLTFNWELSQQTIVQNFNNKHTHLGQVINKILNQSSFHIKGITLTFIKNLIEKSDLRPIMKVKFINYVFNHIITPIIQYFNSTDQLEILCEFLIRIYNIDPLRTRRVIVESALLIKLEKRMKNKYILLTIIKLLKAFLNQTQSGIFTYIQKRDLFQQIRGEYHRIKTYHSQGIVRSAFLELIKLIPHSKSSLGVEIISSLFLSKNQSASQSQPEQKAIETR